MRNPRQIFADHRAQKKYGKHLAADDARLAQMEVTTGQDTPEYFQAWCDRMSYALNCWPGAPKPEPVPDPEPEAGT